MSDEKTIVIADSCCDVPADLADQYNIRILPVHIVYPEGDYLDGVDIQSETIYRRFPAEIPHTSMPSPGEVIDYLEALRDEGYTHVIAVCISDHLSGTVNAVRTYSEEVEDLEVYVYNTKDISIGSGIHAIWAAKQIADGRSFAEVTKGLESKRDDSHLMFYLDTLEYLYKGGRIGHLTNLVAGVLNLKPIISCDPDGIYYTVAKLRGAKRAMAKLIDELKAAASDKKCWVAIMHGGAKEACLNLERMIKEAIPQAEIIAHDRQINPSLAVHTGPGLVGAVIYTEP